MSSMPPPRKRLQEDYEATKVEVDGVVFVMMNPAPGRRSAAADRPRSESSSSEREFLRDNKINAGSNISGEMRDANLLPGSKAERAEIHVLKPRSTQTRYATARLQSFSCSKLKKSQPVSKSEKGSGLADGNASRLSLREEGKFQMPMPRHQAGRSVCGSTSDAGDSGEATVGASKSSGKGNVKGGSGSQREYRDGYALMSGVHHQIPKPGASAARPRNKLHKPQKGIKKGRVDSPGEGSKGPRLVVP